jgi:arginase
MSENNPMLEVFGYASSQAGAHPGTALGPLYIQPLIDSLSNHYRWGDMIYPRGDENGLAALDSVKDSCLRLGLLIKQGLASNNRFLVLGGDHSSAIGTWSAASNHYNNKLGLIWIDAHMDSHTPESSDTKNIHGMPLATLLGHGDSQLCHLFSNKNSFDPKNVCLIAQRDFESAEQHLLESLGVRIFYQSEVDEKGIERCLVQASDYLLNHVPYIGITIDLDAFDPNEIPGVSVPAKNGLFCAPFLEALKTIIEKHHSSLIGYELVEFNPELDQNNKTIDFIKELLHTII